MLLQKWDGITGEVVLNQGNGVDYHACARVLSQDRTSGPDGSRGRWNRVRTCRGATRRSDVNWSALVAPNDRFKPPAMLMSNNWMNAVWSWDHCFNAIALSRGLPDPAWDQLQLPFACAASAAFARTLARRSFRGAQRVDRRGPYDLGQSRDDHAARARKKPSRINPSTTDRLANG